jgi:hypothetical protein
MPSEYGANVKKAFDAVCRLHSDLSRLFSELNDREFNGWTSVYASEVFKRGTRDFKSKVWMPAAVIRFFYNPAATDQTVVEGLTCQFFSKRIEIREPILVASKIKYRLPAKNLQPSNEADGWENWLRASLQDGELRLSDEAQFVAHPEQDAIEWAVVKGQYVYDIMNREAIDQLVGEVRATLPPGDHLHT